MTLGQRREEIGIEERIRGKKEAVFECQVRGRTGHIIGKNDGGRFKTEITPWVTQKE